MRRMMVHELAMVLLGIACSGQPIRAALPDQYFRQCTTVDADTVVVRIPGTSARCTLFRPKGGTIQKEEVDASEVRYHWEAEPPYLQNFNWHTVRYWVEDKHGNSTAEIVYKRENDGER